MRQEHPSAGWGQWSPEGGEQTALFWAHIWQAEHLLQELVNRINAEGQRECGFYLGSCMTEWMTCKLTGEGTYRQLTCPLPGLGSSCRAFQSNDSISCHSDPLIQDARLLLVQQWHQTWRTDRIKCLGSHSENQVYKWSQKLKQVKKRPHLVCLEFSRLVALREARFLWSLHTKNWWSASSN